MKRLVFLMKRRCPTYFIILACLSCCVGCQAKTIRQGLYIAEDNSRGFAFREDGTGWIVPLECRQRENALKPLFWFQTGNDLEIFLESSEAFPYPIVGRVRNVTAESFQFLQSAGDVVEPADALTWTQWLRTSTPLFESWYPGMFQTELASRTNRTAIVDSLADGTIIHLAERLRVVDRKSGQEKQLLQTMQIWVYENGFSPICYKIMVFDRCSRHHSGFTDMIPVICESRQLTAPIESIGNILTQNVVVDPDGKPLATSEPWQASMTYLLNQEEGVKIQNWPVSHVPLSKIWNSFMTDTNRLARKNKGQSSKNGTK